MRHINNQKIKKFVWPYNCITSENLKSSYNYTKRLFFMLFLLIFLNYYKNLEDNIFIII